MARLNLYRHTFTPVQKRKETKRCRNLEVAIHETSCEVWDTFLFGFFIFSNTSYSYEGGLYENNETEFRGFSIVNETFSTDNSTITHFFHQDKELKGKEYRTEMRDRNGNLFSRAENNYNFTTNSIGGFIVQLLSSTSYSFDAQSTTEITNTSFEYDNFSNLISRTQYGDTSITGDEKYENYTYTINLSSWILDKPSWYILFDQKKNKIRETKYFYDGGEYGQPPKKGDLTKVETWLDTGGGNPTTYYTYDDFGNLYTQTDALGRTTTRDYGVKDNTHTYPDRITNPLGHPIDYDYDVATGNVISYRKHGVDFLYEYDTFGRILKDIDPYDTSEFSTKKYTYSFDGTAPENIKVSQKTTSNNTIDVYYLYDGFGNLVQIKSSAENGQQVVKNLFYDGLGRVKEEQNPFFDTSSTVLDNNTNLSNKTRYIYDAVGRVTSVINPDGTAKNTTYNQSIIDDYDENSNRHTYVLDAYGRITEVREYNTDFYIGDNQIYNTTYNYDGADQLVGIRDTYGNTLNFTYDSLGRKIKLKDPDLGTWNYFYDPANNLIKQTDNNGNVVALSYDDLNRILQKNTTNYTLSFAYDRQFPGTLTNISHETIIPSGENYTMAYEYDDRLRITEETITEGGDTSITGNTYDSMDRGLQNLQQNSLDIDYYYNAQGKLSGIRNFTNLSIYNPVGNPLNRTYFNSLVTTFDYSNTNLRLKQIKTNGIQQLNYTYDNAGNIININDSINNRSYVMSYDDLNRLTNVSINSFKWVYNYDALGNILKIVRNFSQTTAFKYEGAIPHAPSKVLTTDTGVDVYRPVIINQSNRTQLIQFFLVNEKNQTISNVNYTVYFGDGALYTASSINLTKGNYNSITVQRNYSAGVFYNVNITGRANTTATDYELLRLIFGTLVDGASMLKKNATLAILEFNAKNSITEQSNNWGWNCSHGLVSTLPFNMSGNQLLMLIIENNFTLNGGANFTCRVNSSDGNQSKTFSFVFDSIKIEGYNSTLVDSDTIRVKFQIKNYYSPLTNINWNITANGLVYSQSSILLSQGQTTTITQDLNFTNAGAKQIKVMVGSGNFTDIYTENVRLYSLGIQQYLNQIKNGTTRIFTFLVHNDWTNLSTYWNFTNPVVTNTLNLSQNESLIVVIEENYGQGQKDISINTFNSSVLEDFERDIFKIKHIGINSFQTLHENASRAVVGAFVVNNVQTRNISWQLNNSQSLISSSQNIELNTSQQAIVVIESNFSSSGIYPLTFSINSSTLGDNATGVAVS